MHPALTNTVDLLYKTAAGVANGKWSYGYDSRDQVTSRADPSTNVYAFRYDEVGRLVDATGVKGTNTTAGYPFRYSYDRAGNRVRQTEGSRQRTLVCNELNQLVSVGRSNEVNVAGWVSEAGTATVVEVRGTATGLWQRVATRYVSHTQAWFEATVNVAASGTNTVWIRAADKTGNASTQAVVVVSASTNMVFGYDPDGNQTNGVTGSYEWDAENRLVRIGYGTNSATRLRYDGLSRLREIAECNSSGTATSTVRYAWNGMLPWAELDGSNRILRTFTWGLDLSGGVGGAGLALHRAGGSGAGGIGGLVGMRDRKGIGTNYLARTDGKGNITEVRRTNAVVVATYAYAPFGNIITNTGTYAQPFRFQTKLAHGKSGLGYWGYRWYEPKTGRWISRDGLGEAGGFNLYQYAWNNPLTAFDPDGREPVTIGVALVMAGILLFAGTEAAIAPANSHDICAYAGTAGEGLGNMMAAAAFGGGTSIAVGSASRIVGRLAVRSPGVKYIGKMDDLYGMPRSQTFLDDLPNLGSPKANYYQNSTVLRKAVRDGYRIRDASAYRPNWSPDPTLLRPDRTVGQSFLGAERLIMDNKGFILDPAGAYVPR